MITRLSKFSIPLLLSICIWSTYELHAQVVHQGLIDRTYLEYVDRLPTNLTSEKSVGILIADTRRQGEKMAYAAHPVFAKSGIDVVAYYHVDDLYAGGILSQPLAEEILKREIVQLIFLIKDTNKYKVVITPFSKDHHFVKNGKKAWKMEASDLNNITGQIYRMSSKLTRKNFLVSDVPEFGSFQYQIKGRRYEAYKSDLKSQKIAVPLLSPLKFPEELAGRTDAQEVLEQVNTYNALIADKNQQIKKAFADYPYPHVFIEEDLTEKQLRKKGYIYVLQHVHTTSNTIRNLLKYEKKAGVTDYVVVRMTGGKGEVIRINGETPVYKYYVKNIPADTYYLGSKWDADYTSEAALNNHVQLLIAQIR